MRPAGLNVAFDEREQAEFNVAPFVSRESAHETVQGFRLAAIGVREHAAVLDPHNPVNDQKVFELTARASRLDEFANELAHLVVAQATSDYLEAAHAG